LETAENEIEYNYIRRYHGHERVPKKEDEIICLHFATIFASPCQLSLWVNTQQSRIMCFLPIIQVAYTRSTKSYIK